MKKFLKSMAAVFMLVLMFGVAASADEAAISPNVITTGTENPNNFAVHSYSYGKSNLFNIGNGTFCGKVVPIQVPGPGTLYFAFTESQSINQTVDMKLMANRNVNQGTNIVYASTSSSVANKVKAVTVSGPATYYFMMTTPSSGYTNLTSNSISFRTYFLSSAYSAVNQTLTSGKTVPLVYNGNDKYYQISLSAPGHIAVAANAKIYIDICNSAKTALYSSALLDPSSNGGVASYFLEAGTYYIKTRGNYDYISALKCTVYPLGTKPYAVTGKNETITISPGNSQNYHYIQYKAPSTGYVTLFARSGAAYVTLCASNRKAMSSEDWIYGQSTTSNTLVYGVKKGTTYYFKVKSSYNPFALTIKTTSVTEKSGSSKSKAVTMKSNKTSKGSIQAGSKTVDWYKFKITKSKKANVWFNGSTNGKMKITIYKGSKRLYTRTISGSGFGIKIYSTGKWAKGTYYVKVERGNSKSSGYYTLKWK